MFKAARHQSVLMIVKKKKKKRFANRVITFNSKYIWIILRLKTSLNVLDNLAPKAHLSCSKLFRYEKWKTVQKYWLIKTTS